MAKFYNSPIMCPGTMGNNKTSYSFRNDCLQCTTFATSRVDKGERKARSNFQCNYGHM